ncbi:hypothetical protein BOX15_Mlig027714g3 [Macrostomum lignano]|nr:hypothetical protein BOX15_Mlig027714g2 [Macrostomum lignano]PAA66684.1 hypothetical protein BOX15_Mlig027714g1 [Macrostomum lignano]PAA74235.1 hypothetical protein BOX15_Mlig027714g4 [Macrostomum lignano]PAA74251.1 hypothetical protein BOX15_Mlig027714g3 [Macrostomum lignano]
MGHSHSRDGMKKVQGELKLSEAETGDMMKRFFQLTNNRDSLSRHQFHETIKRSLHGQPFDKKLWDSVFDMLDLNKDGSIDFYEFSISMVYSSKLPMEKKIDYLFQMMDFNGDGQVSVEEMNRAIRTASRIANNAERVWDLEEYFPTLASRDTLTKREFKDAMSTRKGQELMNCLNFHI